MFDQNYRGMVGRIMAPISDFLRMVDERTQASVVAAQTRYSQLEIVIFSLLGASMLLLLVCLFFAYRVIRSQLGGEPRDAMMVLRKVAEGDLTVKVPVSRRDTGSVLHSTQQMIAKWTNVIGDVSGTASSPGIGLGTDFRIVAGAQSKRLATGVNVEVTRCVGGRNYRYHRAECRECTHHGWHCQQICQCRCRGWRSGA